MNIKKIITPLVLNLIVVFAVIMCVIITPKYYVSQDIEFVEDITVVNTEVEKEIDKLMLKLENLRDHRFKHIENKDEWGVYEEKEFINIEWDIQQRINLAKSSYFNTIEGYALVTRLYTKNGLFYKTTDESTISIHKLDRDNIDPCSIKKEFLEKIKILEELDETARLKEIAEEKLKEQMQEKINCN